MKQLKVTPAAPMTSTPKDLALTKRSWLFPTVQGEGRLIGTPSLFLRLFGCNLACAACDTKYSWKKPDQNRVVVSVSDVVLELETYLASHDVSHVVVTGGEPTLQADALCLLLSRIAPSVHITLETNGLLFHRPLAEYVNLVSLSPKLSLMRVSGVSQATWDWLAWASKFGQQAQVKLVVEDESDLNLAVDLFLHLKGTWVPAEGAIIQPEWTTYGANVKSFLDVATKYGLQVIPQMHKVMGVP